MSANAEHWWNSFPTTGGPAVMATGILAVGLHTAGYEVLSLIALAFAAALWPLLASSFVADVLRGGHRWTTPADAPPALTVVAATTVLGARLSMLGWLAGAAALLVLAVAAWPAPVAEELRRGRHRLAGASFLACVATQGIAVLAAAVAAGTGDSALAWAAFAVFCLGAALYVEVSVHFDLRQVRIGKGDQWVAAGAAAICALAASELTVSPVFTGTLHTALATATLVFLALDLTGYAILLAAELHWPRLRYDARRWATVFPLGMSAAACMSAATATGIGWLRPLGVVLLWVAVAAWLYLVTNVVAITEGAAVTHHHFPGAHKP